MNDPKKDWKFSDLIEAERRKQLLMAPPFEDIVQKILKEMKILDCYLERAEDNPDCRRVEFMLEVSPDTFDQFFNSPTGYRAQYYRSPDFGDCRNGYIINILRPKLIDHAQANSSCGSRILEINESLNPDTSKIWIDEEEQHIRKLTPRRDILLPSWLDESKKNTALGRATKLGVHAYKGQRLKVMGGFLENDWCPWDSKDGQRAQQIHDWGFT